MLAPLQASWFSELLAIEIDPSFERATPDFSAGITWFSAVLAIVKSDALQPFFAYGSPIETTASTVLTSRLDLLELSAVNVTGDSVPGASSFVIVPCSTSVPLLVLTEPDPVPEPDVVQ